MTDKDVTEHVEYYNFEQESMAITQCVCGAEFEPWKFNIYISREEAERCPQCGRALYFRAHVCVYEVTEEGSPL